MINPFLPEPLLVSQLGLWCSSYKTPVSRLELFSVQYVCYNNVTKGASLMELIDLLELYLQASDDVKNQIDLLLANSESQIESRDSLSHTPQETE